MTLNFQSRASEVARPGNVMKNRLEAFCWRMVNAIWKGKCRIEISYKHLQKIVS